VSSLELLAKQRHLYGNTYLTVFPDGLLVPWRTLSVQEFLEYSEAIARGHFPLAVFEDEIFKRCVRESYFIRQQENLKAGVITTVVEAIWDFSLPKLPQQVAGDLEGARQEYEGDYRVIHDLVTIILMAFPYKPEEVYSMSYEQLIKTLVLADRKLIGLGIKQEPTTITLVDQQTQEVPTPPKPKVDAKKLWEEQHPDPFLPKEPPKEVQPTNKKGKWYKKSPVLEVKPTHGVRVGEEDPDFFALSGHELQDLPLQRAIMVQDAQIIYKDLIEELEKRNTKSKK
jgi:hypothetical protein